MGPSWRNEHGRLTSAITLSGTVPNHQAVSDHETREPRDSPRPTDERDPLPNHRSDEPVQNLHLLQ